jgi:hypothetical protein
VSRLRSRRGVRRRPCANAMLAVLWLLDKWSPAAVGPANVMPTEGVDDGCRAVTAALRGLSLRSELDHAQRWQVAATSHHAAPDWAWQALQ